MSYFWCDVTISRWWSWRHFLQKNPTFSFMHSAHAACARHNTIIQYNNNNLCRAQWSTVVESEARAVAELGPELGTYSAASSSSWTIKYIRTCLDIGSALSRVLCDSGLCMMLTAWVRPVCGNPFKAYCCCCRVKLMVRLSSLKQHARTTKHIQNQKMMTSKPTTAGLLHIHLFSCASLRLILRWLDFLYLWRSSGPTF